MPRIVTISDTHSRHRKISTMPEGDILIHSGDATNRGIKGLLGKLSSLDPSDTLILVLAGHGDLHDGEWYFLPHDVDLKNVSKTAISIRELQDALVNSPVKRVFLMAGARPVHLDQLAAVRQRDVGLAQIGAAETQVGDVGVTAGNGDEFAVAGGRRDHRDAAAIQRADADVAVGLDGQRIKALIHR